MTPQVRQELFGLLEAVCEQRATAEQQARLEQLVLADSAARRLYVNYMDLHGTLHWDAAGVGALEFSPARALPRRQPARRRILAGGLAAAVLVATVLAGMFFLPGGKQLAQRQDPQPVVDPPAPAPQVASSRSNGGMVIPDRPLPPVMPAPELPVVQSPAVTSPPQVARVELPVIGDTDEAVIAFVNSQLSASWFENQVSPSPAASESEWVRRVWLDLGGRIPTREEAAAALADNRAGHRQRLVDRLLASPDYARSSATAWTNLLVGRSPEQAIERELLLAWMKEGFADNRPWNETVSALLTAEGSTTDNGPVNFLLAHLNNQAVPATAITARILLCEQLQCAQCHTHPMVKEWGQERFWEINAFFRSVRVVERMEPANPAQPVRSRRPVRRLVERDVPFRPSFYETLQGVMKVAYPKVGDVEFTNKPSEPLRGELSRLLLAGDRPQPARAFVNRTWGHFFGHGFTTPLDDMGPHHPASHPVLLEGLTQAFVRSGYNVERLARWICLSDAYALSSEYGERNSSDDPASGERPQFSRMYVKTLAAEPLYDSLLIAAGVAPEELNQPMYQRRRELWLEQFFKAVENDENGESTTLDGSLPQALMMMNGELVARATSLEPGSELAEILAQPDLSDQDRLRQLSLAALALDPSPERLDRLRELFRQQARQLDTRRISTTQAQAEAYRDVYWALLNSSEFGVNR